MDTQIQAFFDQANKMREEKQVPKFRYDVRLEKSAQKHATDLGAGTAQPHDQLQWRIYTYGGFPNEPCHVSRPGMAANYSEGIVNMPSMMTLEEGLPSLVSSGRGEAHYDDFFDPKITHVGIGYVQGGKGYYSTRIVVDYGVLCHPDPEPTPTPKPEPDRELLRNVFDLW